MKIPDKWWSAPAEGDNGKTVIVTGLDGVDALRGSGKYIYRLDVSWDYDPLPSGMPSDDDARLMEQATDSLIAAFKKNKAAVMTGIYTGDGRRDWIFYCLNLRVFSGVFNKALADLPQMPLKIEATEDPEWEEYLTMRENTYIDPDAE
ncbi:MAG: DUF695 domain-containing protein [Muribaculaceae bacterium]|nr:DUF695 domain-containing protein [Muribaculaceae bacterium]